MKQHVAAQVSLDLAPDLLPARVVAKVPSPQALLLISADLEQGASLLLSIMPNPAQASLAY